MKVRDFRKVLERVIEHLEIESERRHNELLDVLQEIKAILNKDKPPK